MFYPLLILPIATHPAFCSRPLWTSRAARMARDLRIAGSLWYTISLDHQSKAVVLACRGTLGFEDVLADLTCDYDDLVWRGESYKVHKGIHASARRLHMGATAAGARHAQACSSRNSPTTAWSSQGIPSARP